jgi:exodeoxyribonuclease I
MQKTYLFYDLETTGLNACFDQVLQFAAIRTTLDLKELDRYQFFIQLNKDVVPSPSAIITHRIPISALLDGVSEFEGISKIHALLNAPGTISLGYNTLGFDDEFLRFSFYRNLLPPYTHQYARQCGRADIFPLTILYFLYQKQALNWPMENGHPVLKLERLNEANSFFEGPAHDAMVDVEVTLQLAKKLYQVSEMWQYAMAYFNKWEDQQRIGLLTQGLYGQQEALAISPELGIQHNFQSMVLNLGAHAYYTNQTLWLRLDHLDFSEMDQKILAEKVWVLKKRFGEPCFLLPCKKRFMDTLKDEQIVLIEKNRQFLLSHPELFQAIVEYQTHYQYPEWPNVDVDAALYQAGFMQDHEKRWCEAFHRASLDKKIQLLDQPPSPLLEQQALRILGRHFSDRLSPEQSRQFDLYLKSVLTSQRIDFKGQSHLNAASALEEIQNLRKHNKLDEEQQSLLDELEQYLKDKK